MYIGCYILILSDNYLYVFSLRKTLYLPNVKEQKFLGTKCLTKQSTYLLKITWPTGLWIHEFPRTGKILSSGNPEPTIPIMVLGCQMEYKCRQINDQKGNCDTSPSARSIEKQAVRTCYNALGRMLQKAGNMN